MAPRIQLRLWVVALALLLGGFAGRIALVDFGSVSHGYPTAVQLQAYCYGLGLLLLFLSWANAANPWWGRYGGWLWLVLAASCGLAILSTVPK